MNISIGNDHTGTDYKFAIKELLNSKNIVVTNYGTNSDESVDYPDFVHPVARDIVLNKADFGILLCGSANGVAMAANKHKEIRAGVCWTIEVAELIRKHNHANVLCIPSRYTSKSLALEMVEVFLSTDFEGGRHIDRIKKIPFFEQ